MFASTEDAWVLLADLDGQQIYHRNRQPGQALPRRNPASLVFQRQAMESRSPVVSGLVIGALAKTWIVNIEVPVLKDGKPFRGLIVSSAPRGFYDLLNAQSMPEGWLLGIIDRDGRRIARVPRNDETIGQLASEGWRKVRAQEGVFEVSSIEGDPTITANALSKLSGWSIGVAATRPRCRRQRGARSAGR